MTYTKKSVIPTTAAIKQSREVQSQLDRAKHEEYHEAEVKAEILMNNLQTSIRPKAVKPFKPTAEQVKSIKATSEWKRVHGPKDGIGPANEMSMADLTSKMSEAGALRNPDHPDAPARQASIITSARYGSDGKIIPQAGQWYQVIKYGYYVMWEGDKSYFVSSDDFGTIKYLAAKVIESIMPSQNEVVCASVGRIHDIINQQPSIEDLQKARYRFMPLNLAERAEFGQSDIENAIPLF